MVNVKDILGGGNYKTDFKIFFYKTKIRASLYITDFRVDSPYFIHKINEMFPGKIVNEPGHTFIVYNDDTNIDTIKRVVYDMVKDIGGFDLYHTKIQGISIDINQVVAAFEGDVEYKPSNVEEYLNWKIKL